MKRFFYPISIISVLIYWSCEDKVEEDTTPPTVSITYPLNNSTVSEMVTINCISSDNEGVEKLDLWVNGIPTGITDNSEPYSFEWNTTILNNESFNISVRSFDRSDNTTESDPIALTVDNTQSNPTSAELYPIIYNDGFQLSWSKNNEDDFQLYKLYESTSEDMTGQTLVYETDDIIDTTYFLSLETLKYYQVLVEDVWGYQSKSNIISGDYNVELWGESYSVLNTTELILVNSGLTGSIPSKIGSLTNLNVLILGGNQLSGSIPPEIENLNNLTILNLQSNQLTGSIFSGIGNLNNLEILNLLGNQLTGEIPQEIGNLSNLFELGLSSNKLSGIIPDEICNQGDSSPDLSNNQFCPPYPPCIEVDIREQELVNCDGVVELWGEYYSIEYTTEINLSNGELTGEIPPELGNLTNLESLNLFNNQLTGEIPPQIGNLTNLNTLVLWMNQLTGEIPSELGNLTNLIRLDLDENQLTGSIPSQIWNLPNLTDLFLSSNQLTGSIPAEVSNLTNLTYLFLHSNQLTGTIPLEVSNLTYLKYLRLNNNQLSGEISESICNLDIFWNIAYDFNISNNQFCPPYPSCLEDLVGEQDTSNCD
jgi:Leucine-rich repeat (LRR) protein